MKGCIDEEGGFGAGLFVRVERRGRGTLLGLADVVRLEGDEATLRTEAGPSRTGCGDSSLRRFAGPCDDAPGELRLVTAAGCTFLGLLTVVVAVVAETEDTTCAVLTVPTWADVRV